jgi:hypothetical protein
MGQAPVCSFCSDSEKDISLKPQLSKPQVIMSEYKPSSTSQKDPLILKGKHDMNLNSFNLTYIGGYTTVIKEGFGILRWENNCEFKGNFHNGVPSGWGIYYNSKIGKYNGEYEDNKRNGYGIFRHISNSIYEGNWVNEKQGGIGIEKWEDGSLYQGEFINGEKCGTGIYFFPDGNIYLGEWRQNKMNGYGIYTYDKKNKLYMGEWLNGARNGYGEVYSNHDHNYFFGFFRNNLQNGFFMLYNIKSKKIIVGFYTNGKVDEIVKYFRRKEEGKLLIVKNGKKIKEIENEEKIEKYLKNKEHFGKNSQFMKNIGVQKYFYMKRKDLENILSDKVNVEEINCINERLGKDINDNNNINNE